MIFYLTLGNRRWLPSSNGGPAFSTKCHCTINLITAVTAVHLLFPFLVSGSVFLVLFRHRRGRKTKTSSDASDEAPERARKDAPKEVKLHESSILFSRLSGKVSRASIRRFPWPQGRGATSAPSPVWSRHARPSLRGKSVAAAIRGKPLFALAEMVYQKSDPRAE